MKLYETRKDHIIKITVISYVERVYTILYKRLNGIKNDLLVQAIALSVPKERTNHSENTPLLAIYRNYSTISAKLRYIPHDLSQIRVKYFTTYRKGGRIVSTKEAIANRILQLCEERNIAVNELANISGVSPSTVYSILNEKSQNPGAITIKKLCDGLEITLGEFFSTSDFDALEQEII